jgi:hypothetical protein
MKNNLGQFGIRAQVNAVMTDKHMHQLARKLVRKTISYAGKPRTGHYRRGVKAEIVNTPSRHLAVAATDFKSHWIEDGAGPSPRRGGKPFLGRHPLERAFRSEGLEYRKVWRPGP